MPVQVECAKALGWWIGVASVVWHAGASVCHAGRARADRPRDRDGGARAEAVLHQHLLQPGRHGAPQLCEHAGALLHHASPHQPGALPPEPAGPAAFFLISFTSLDAPQPFQMFAPGNLNVSGALVQDSQLTKRCRGLAQVHVMLASHSSLFAMAVGHRSCARRAGHVESCWSVSDWNTCVCMTLVLGSNVLFWWLLAQYRRGFRWGLLPLISNGKCAAQCRRGLKWGLLSLIFKHSTTSIMP